MTFFVLGFQLIADVYSLVGLLDQKGVHKSGPSAGDELSPSPPAEGAEKPSLGTKIKEKLHIGSKHKNDE